MRKPSDSIVRDESVPTSNTRWSSMRPAAAPNPFASVLQYVCLEKLGLILLPSSSSRLVSYCPVMRCSSRKWFKGGSAFDNCGGTNQQNRTTAFLQVLIVVWWWWVVVVRVNVGWRRRRMPSSPSLRAAEINWGGFVKAGGKRWIILRYSDPLILSHSSPSHQP